MPGRLENLFDFWLPFLVGAAVFLVVFRLFLSWKRKACDWRRLKVDDEGQLRKFRCRTCGVEAYSATGRPPIDCKKALKPKPL